MGKKKRGRNAAEDVGPDPRILELGSIITNEMKTREKEERAAKHILLPLKRVNSCPTVYQFLPMSKCLFSDSRSVDYGFDGTVDVPNQVVYMEEVPDDILDTTPVDNTLLDATPYSSSPDIDASDMKALDAIKKHDMTHFLKRRVGEKNLEKIYDTVKLPHTDLPKTEGSISSKSRRCCCWCAVTAVLFFLVSAVLIGLALAGIHIPILSNFLFPARNTSEDVTVTDVTSANSTTATDTAVAQVAIAGLGFNSGQYSTYESEMDVIDADLATIDGQKMDVSFEYVWPPDEKKAKKVEVMFDEVYEYLGFDTDGTIVDEVEPIDGGIWKLRVRTFARAKRNQDLMMWYGFNENSTKFSSEFTKRMNKYHQEVFLILHNATMNFYSLYFGESFVEETKRYFGKIKVRRPPAHIPDEWGHCTGSPVCP